MPYELIRIVDVADSRSVRSSVESRKHGGENIVKVQRPYVPGLASVKRLVGQRVQGDGFRTDRFLVRAGSRC